MTTPKSRAALLSLMLATAIQYAAARADVIIYATDSPPQLPSHLVSTFEFPEIGTSRFFDVFVSTDVHIPGISLDIFTIGPSIRLTDIEIPNPSGPRWAAIEDGAVVGGGASIEGATAFALPGISGIGMNPFAPDSGYSGPPVNAFHFARVHYDILSWGVSEVSMSIGDNEIALVGDSCIRFGGADQCQVFPQGDLHGQFHVATISDIPEPTSLILAIGLGLAVACSSRRRGR
jgi:hypothetical protein